MECLDPNDIRCIRLRKFGMYVDQAGTLMLGAPPGVPASSSEVPQRSSAPTSSSEVPQRSSAPSSSPTTSASDAKTQKNVEKLLKKAKQHLDHLQSEAWRKLNIDKMINVETVEQHKYARFADVAYAHGYRDKKRAQRILDEGARYIPELTDFKIDMDLSTPNEVVLHNATTGEVHISYRGSDTQFFDKKKFQQGILKGLQRSLNEGKISLEQFMEAKEELKRVTNVYDWYVNAMTGVGQQHNTQRYKNIVETAKNVAEKYGISPEELTLSGHSKGGGEARYVAEQLGVKDNHTHIFDAADSPFTKYVKLGEGVERAPKIKAYRTPQGIVSSGHVIHPKEHLDVTTITPLPGNEDLVSAHAIENYYTNEPKMRQDGTLEVERVGRIRNAVASTGNTALGLVGGVALSEAMLPQDEIKSGKSQGFLVGDALKAAVPEVDPGDTLVNFLDVQGMSFTAREKEYIRTKVLGGDDDPAPSNPDNDSALTKTLNKLGGMRRKKIENYETQRDAWVKNQFRKDVPVQTINEKLGTDFIETGLPEQPDWVKRHNNPSGDIPKGYNLGEATHHNATPKTHL